MGETSGISIDKLIADTRDNHENHQLLKKDFEYLRREHNDSISRMNATLEQVVMKLGELVSIQKQAEQRHKNIDEKVSIQAEHYKEMIEDQKQLVNILFSRVSDIEKDVSEIKTQLPVIKKAAAIVFGVMATLSAAYLTLGK